MQLISVADIIFMFILAVREVSDFNKKNFSFYKVSDISLKHNKALIDFIWHNWYWQNFTFQ